MRERVHRRWVLWVCRAVGPMSLNPISRSSSHSPPHRLPRTSRFRSFHRGARCTNTSAPRPPVLRWVQPWVLLPSHPPGELGLPSPPFFTVPPHAWCRLHTSATRRRLQAMAFAHWLLATALRPGAAPQLMARMDVPHSARAVSVRHSCSPPTQPPPRPPLPSATPQPMGMVLPPSSESSLPCGAGTNATSQPPPPRCQSAYAEDDSSDHSISSESTNNRDDAEVDERRHDKSDNDDIEGVGTDS